MIIGVDMRVLGSRRKSGIEEYTEQLLAHMIPLDPEIHYKLFYSSLTHSAPWYPWMRLPNVSVHAFRIPNNLLFIGSYLLNRPKIDQLIGGADVFFSPHFFLAPLSASCRRVTTFHDLSYLQFPEFFSWRRRTWHTLEMRPSWQARFSDRIIAMSESTKQDIIERYHIDPARISMVHSGVDGSFTRPPDHDLARFRRDRNLPEQFMLFLGTLEPRKNVEGVIRAFTLLKNSGAVGDLHLVIAGAEGWLHGGISSEINRSPYRHQIHCVGHISDRDRPYYYSLASVFVYPSFFEGFGFPPLEAMACGTPVVASQTTSLPEVVGDGGLLVDPYSPSDIASAVTNILTDAELRKNLIAKGLKRAQQFTWDAAARQTLDILKNAVE